MKDHRSFISLCWGILFAPIFVSDLSAQELSGEAVAAALEKSFVSAVEQAEPHGRRTKFWGMAKFGVHQVIFFIPGN